MKYKNIFYYLIARFIWTFGVEERDAGLFPESKLSLYRNWADPIVSWLFKYGVDK